MKSTNPKDYAFYDAECNVCSTSARRFERVFNRLGCRVAPFQGEGVRQRLGLSPEAPFEEMWVLTADGRALGGADALIELSRRVWWGWPFYLVASLPVIKPLVRALYRWFAARRHRFPGVGKGRQP